MSIVQTHENHEGTCPKCKRPFHETDLLDRFKEQLYAEQPISFECHCGAELTFNSTITWLEVLS